jgi:murein DD-endopeptidase MepM/ murein hydrolase activator NlpD
VTTTATERQLEEQADFTTIEKFRAAKVSYSREMARMRSIVFSQFFRVHGLDEQFLKDNFPVEFRQIEQQFYGQLELTFRTLSIDDIAKLKDTGARVGLVLSLYTTLSTNPYFVGNLQKIKEVYIANLPAEQRDATDHSIAQKAQNIIEELKQDEDAQQKNPPEDNYWTTLTNEEIERILDQNEFASPEGLTALLRELSLNDADQGTLLHRMGAVLFRRLPPESIRQLSKSRFKEMFGISPSMNDAEFTELKDALANYLVFGQARLFEKHNKDAIFHVQVNPNGSGEVSDSQIKAVDYFSRRATDMGIAASAFAEAAMLTKAELDQLDEEEQHIKVAYDALTTDLLDLQLQHLIGEQKKAQLRGAEANVSHADIERLVQSYSYYDQDTVFSNQRPVRSQGGYAMSPFSSGLKTAQNVATQLVDSAIGEAIADSTGFGAALPGPIKQKIGEATRETFTAGAGIFLGSLLMSLFSGLGSLVGMVGGAIGGALMGAAAGTALLPGIGTIVGGVVGGITGGATGGILGSKLSGVGSKMLEGMFGGGGGGVPAVSSAATKTPFAAKLNPSLVFKGSAFQIGSVATAGALGLPIVVGLYTSLTNTGAFIVFPTTNSQGEESKYVQIEKKSNPGPILNNPGDTPTTVTYTIRIKPKAGYKIEILDISDKYSARTEKGDIAAPPDPEISMTTLAGKTTLDAANNDEIAFTPYTGTFDKSFSDASVTNTVKLTFKAYATGSTTPVKDAGKEELDAQTSQILCFGKCPQQKGKGCWPVSGSIGQMPFSEGFAKPGTHASLDAFDIMAGAGQPIKASYGGKACIYSYDTYNSWNWPKDYDALGRPKATYGISVTIEGSDPDVGDYSLIFAHMSETNIPQGCTTVTPGEVIGLVGSTGLSSGPHLHYELKHPFGAYAPPSRFKGFVPDGQSVHVNSPVVSTCGGGP